LRRLSKGQLQRVGLAQASVHRPDLFILDEPMSGLDPLRRAQVKAWIRAMRREGRTVLLASHVLADVEALADRVGILLEGRIVRETTAEELLEGEEQGTEVEFTMPAGPRELLAEIPANLEERAGIWAASFTAGSEMAVHALIARVLSHGGAIRSVLRNRRSLETLYVDSMRDHAAPAARKEARR
jgi:ABC-2 type transport system ATP-binding protein